MRQWHYTQEGQQHGPVSEPDLVRLFETRQLSPDTLVWTEGLKEWVPARNVDGLVPSAHNPTSPTIPQPVVTPALVSDYTPSGEQVRPWVRYWARTIDIFLFAVLTGILLAFVYEPALEIPDIWLGVILLFAYVFVEPAMLAGWGTTPGKALFKVRLRDSEGSKLSYVDALSRALKVWFLGLGIGIPIFALFTQIYAYNKLTKQGVTPWDKDRNFTVTHQVIGAWRIIVIVLIFIAFMFLMALGEADM